MDSEKTVDELKRKVIDFRDRRNWKQFHDLKNLALGLSIESAELLELFLWINPDELEQMTAKSDFREKLGQEIADVFVYLLYLSEAAGIDLSEAMENKIRINENKYPVAKSYNNSKKYTDL